MFHKGLDDVRSYIRSHDEDGVLEIDRPALVIGQTSVVQYLKKGVEHIRMGLFYLVEQHYRIRFAAYGFGQLTSLVVSHIARRRTDQPAYGMTFLIFAHVDSSHHVLVIEKEFGQCLRQLGLSHTGRTHEQE